MVGTRSSQVGELNIVPVATLHWRRRHREVCLERDMQLKREIAINFLPSESPAMDSNMHGVTTISRARVGTEPDMLEELRTVDEVAALLKVPRSWVYEHTRSC
jgi:hypothetical protein